MSITAFITIVLFPFFFGDPVNPETGEVVFEEIVEVDSLTQYDMFIGGKAWIADKMISAEIRLITEDSQGGLIVGTGMTKTTLEKGYLGDTEINFYYSVKLEFKEGKYRSQFYDIRYKELNVDPKLEFKNTAENFYNNPDMIKKNGELRSQAQKYRATTLRVIEQYQKELKRSILSRKW